MSTVRRNQCLTRSCSHASLYLDPQIRNWVVFPITIVMVSSQNGWRHAHQLTQYVLIPQILVGLLRHYVTLLLQSSPKKQPAAVIREQYVSWTAIDRRVIDTLAGNYRRALLRAQILRQSSKHSPLPPSYYHTISSSLQDGFAKGTYLKDGPRDPKAPAPSALNPLTDPSAMDGMMDNMKVTLARAFECPCLSLMDFCRNK